MADTFNFSNWRRQNILYREDAHNHPMYNSEKHLTFEQMVECEVDRDTVVYRLKFKEEPDSLVEYHTTAQRVLRYAINTENRSFESIEEVRDYKPSEERDIFKEYITKKLTGKLKVEEII